MQKGDNSLLWISPTGRYQMLITLNHMVYFDQILNTYTF